MLHLRRIGLYLCVTLTATVVLYALSAGLHVFMCGVGRWFELSWLCSIANYFPTDIFAITIPVALFWCIAGVWSGFACYLTNVVWQQLEQ
ncbi:MAG: hypothetical protein ACI392_01355 [Paludibacteraceae bacterium]